MTILLFIFGFALGASALLFALQNSDIVALTFMGWHFDSSLALLVIVSVVVGMLISMLAFLPSAVSGSLRIMGLKSEKRKLEEEVVVHREALASALQPLP